MCQLCYFCCKLLGISTSNIWQIRTATTFFCNILFFFFFSEILLPWIALSSRMVLIGVMRTDTFGLLFILENIRSSYEHIPSFTIKYNFSCSSFFVDMFYQIEESPVQFADVILVQTMYVNFFLLLLLFLCILCV